MALGSVKTLMASAARTASGVSAASGLVVEASSKVAVGIDITAVAGVTPTFDAVVQWSHDGGTTWLTSQAADSFAQATVAGAAVKLFDVKGPHMRVSYTVTGTTPSFTFSVTAVSV